MNTRQYLNDRKFIYLIEFKPSLLSSGDAKRKIKEAGGVIIEAFRKTYHGWQIQANHKLDCSWIFETLKEFGKVGEILEYEYTSDIEDLPSHSLNNEEADCLEGQIRDNVFDLKEFLYIVVSGAIGLLCLKKYLSEPNAFFMVISIVCLGFAALFIWGRVISIKEGAKKEFSRNDWVAIDAICCNSWLVRTEKENITTDEICYEDNYYCELAAGNFALDRIFGDDKKIGESRKIFYNKKSGEIR